MKKGPKVCLCAAAFLSAVLFLVAPVPFAAAAPYVQIFVCIDGIAGSCSGAPDDTHANWIEAFAYGDAITNADSAAGPGVSTGKAEFSPITIIKGFDKTSPKLRLNVAAGTHIKRVYIEFYEAGTKVFQVQLDDVMITAIQTLMPELLASPAPALTLGPTIPSIDPSIVQERMSMSFSRIIWTSYAGGVVTGGWDLKMNKQTK